MSYDLKKVQKRIEEVEKTIIQHRKLIYAGEYSDIGHRAYSGALYTLETICPDHELLNEVPGTKAKIGKVMTNNPINFNDVVKDPKKIPHTAKNKSINILPLYKGVDGCVQFANGCFSNATLFDGHNHLNITKNILNVKGVKTTYWGYENMFVLVRYVLPSSYIKNNNIKNVKKHIRKELLSKKPDDKFIFNLVAIAYGMYSNTEKRQEDSGSNQISRLSTSGGFISLKYKNEEKHLLQFCSSLEHENAMYNFMAYYVHDLTDLYPLEGLHIIREGYQNEIIRNNGGLLKQIEFKEFAKKNVFRISKSSLKDNEQYKSQLKCRKLRDKLLHETTVKNELVFKLTREDYLTPNRRSLQERFGAISGTRLYKKITR